MSLYKLRVRQLVSGIREHLIEAETQVEADWRGHAVCEEHGWQFVSAAPAVIATAKSHPMPGAEAAKKSARVGV